MKMQVFKDATDWMKLQNSENGDRLVRLTGIEYLHRDEKTGLIVSHKQEPHKTVCELRNLNQEVSRHNLEYYVAELQRMGVHYPMFASTPSSTEYLAELKARLFKQVGDCSGEFGNLVSASQPLLFKQLLYRPRILTSLGESRLNCLTNMSDLSGNSMLTGRTASLSHEQPVTTVLNVDDESFASGDMEGGINVYNITTACETHKFKMRGITPVTSLGRIRTTYDMIGSEAVAVDDGDDRHDKNIFLVSGHASPEPVVSVWDLKKQKFVKQLRGHTDDITAIASLQDGHTLITGSRSGTTIVYNIGQQQPVKTI